jgi:catechol 2,3-dioxygenase-like lactoylglutathione lyase family enzyme
MAHGEINHVEFPVDDPQRAMRFYTAVAGWEFGEMPEMPGYHLFRSGEGYGRRGQCQRGITIGPSLRLYIEVGSIEEALAASGPNQRHDEGAEDRHPRLGLVRRRDRSRGHRHRAFSRRPAADPPQVLRIGLTIDPDALDRQPLPHPVGPPPRTSTRSSMLTGVGRRADPRAGLECWSSEAALGLVERHPWLDAAVGVHPHDAAKVTAAEWARIAGLATDPRVVAIGETGLDYDRVFSPIPDQHVNLRRNLVLALETGKPAILHVRSPAGRRDAQDALLDELRGAGFGGPAVGCGVRRSPPASDSLLLRPGGLLRGGPDLGPGSISGLSPSGRVRSRPPGRHRSADRLLVETDSPYLSPPGGPAAERAGMGRITAPGRERWGSGPDEDARAR